MAFGSVLTAEQDSAVERKQRGAFFTPPKLAEYLADRTIRRASDTVLEPSCGEGEFLVAAVNRLRELGASDVEIGVQVTGNELHAESMRQAGRKLSSLGITPQLRSQDFFTIECEQRFDVVMGNPPYIRYQDFSGQARDIALSRAADRGVRISSLSSSWAPFVIHAMGFLVPGGSLGLVLPAELLTSGYGHPVRRHLLDSFAHVEVVQFVQPVFPEVQEEVVLLIATGFGEGPTGDVAFRSVSDERSLPGSRCHAVAVGELDRWPLGRRGAEALDLLYGLRSEGMVPLCEWGCVRLGVVTGANAFFALSKSEVRQWSLGHEDVMSLCPPGSRHLRKLDYGCEERSALIEDGKAAFLFYPATSPSQSAEAYIRYGEDKGFDKSYKCRTRPQWWRVPGVTTYDAFLTYMNGVGPNICSNSARAVCLNSVHGISFRKDLRDMGMRALPMLSLSTVFQLSAEAFGRSYGGGLLKVEPREASRLLLPDAERLLGCDHLIEGARDRASRLLETGDREGAARMADDLLMQINAIDADELSYARALLQDLRSRRIARSKQAKR